MPTANRRAILVATTNAGKLREIREILSDLPIEILSLADVATLPEPEETGRTFAENARLKAAYYACATALPVVGEDSGLEIDALDGAPGIESARFPGATYPEKFNRLYAMLDARGGRESTARFVCALALLQDGTVLFETEATVEGHIAPEPRGSGGFGYDPIFYYPAYGRTLGEASAEEKAAVSHRGKAFRALRHFLAAHP